MAVFDVGQSVVNSAAGLVSGDTSIDISSAITDLSATLESMEIGELVILALETLIVSFCMKIMSVLITVILYVRMIEIYLYTSVAPIPFANDEQQRVGTDRNELFQRTLCPGIPGISDDGMCCYLRSISGRHPVFR